MERVHADYDVIAEMAQSDPDEPVVMLNMLKYRETARDGFGVDGLSGRDAYGVYGRAFAELNPRFGGEPIWMGKAGRSVIGDDDWDIVILVRYPKRSQFMAMFQDPDYQAIAPIRAAALADSLLIESTQLLPKTED